MDSNSLEFETALLEKNLGKIKKIPKGDLHNHGILGCPIHEIDALSKKTVRRLPERISSIKQIDDWVQEVIKPLCDSEQGFIELIGRAMRAADLDGVTVSEMSFGASTLGSDVFHGDENRFVECIKIANEIWAPKLKLKPEVGLMRSMDPKKLYKWCFKLLDTGFFKSLDLYGEENSRPIKAFKKIYQKAGDYGIKLKAHIGETGKEDIISAVELLGLQTIQHGISAAASEKVIHYIARNDIQMNLCISSNIRLGLVPSYVDHPIKRLFEAGIKLTIGTDDLAIFNKSVSEEFLALYSTANFSISDLDKLRINSLKE